MVVGEGEDEDGGQKRARACVCVRVTDTDKMLFNSWPRKGASTLTLGHRRPHEERLAAVVVLHRGLLLLCVSHDQASSRVQFQGAQDCEEQTPAKDCPRTLLEVLKLWTLVRISMHDSAQCVQASCLTLSSFLAATTTSWSSFVPPEFPKAALIRAFLKRTVTNERYMNTNYSQPRLRIAPRMGNYSYVTLYAHLHRTSVPCEPAETPPLGSRCSGTWQSGPRAGTTGSRSVSVPTLCLPLVAPHTARTVSLPPPAYTR